MNAALVYRKALVQQKFSNESFSDTSDKKGSDYKKSLTDFFLPQGYWESGFGFLDLEENSRKTLDIKIRYIFNEKEIERNLLSIRQDVEESCEIDNEINRIEEQAYKDIKLLLNTISETDHNLDLPEFDWAEDGSLSVTWFHTKGRATIRVYGDNVAIFSIYFGEKRQLGGVCELSDTCMLFGFVQTLSCIFNQ